MTKYIKAYDTFISTHIGKFIKFGAVCGTAYGAYEGCNMYSTAYKNSIIGVEYEDYDDKCKKYYKIPFDTTYARVALVMPLFGCVGGSLLGLLGPYFIPPAIGCMAISAIVASPCILANSYMIDKQAQYIEDEMKKLKIEAKEK